MIRPSLEQEELLQRFDERRRPTEGRPVSEVKAVPRKLVGITEPVEGLAF